MSTNIISTDVGKPPYVLTEESLLAQFNGNRKLLKKVAELFVAQSPQYLDEIESALSGADTQAVTRSAHTLKGAIGYIVKEGPFETALKLEVIGRNEDLTEASQTYECLKKEVLVLKTRLSEILEAMSDR